MALHCTAVLAVHSCNCRLLSICEHPVHALTRSRQRSGYARRGTSDGQQVAPGLRALNIRSISSSSRASTCRLASAALALFSARQGGPAAPLQPVQLQPLAAGVQTAFHASNHLTSPSKYCCCASSVSPCSCGVSLGRFKPGALAPAPFCRRFIAERLSQSSWANFAKTPVPAAC